MDKKYIVHAVQKFSKFILFGALTCGATIALATSIPNNSRNPKTFLGPTAHLGVARALSDNTAVYVAGEAGLRNFRLSGTFGWEMTYYQRIKATAELLRQKITYSFFDGRQDPWMNQGALGLDYQYDFHESAPYETQLDMGAYVSHAPSKNLGTGSGVFSNQFGIPTFYSVQRRVAGSNAYGFSPGVGFSPWYGSNVTARLNYDNVRYDNDFGSPGNATGFGGTIRVDQMIVQDVNLGLSAAVRQPFNDYQADLAFGNIPYYGLWTFKLFGEYTIGKNQLPTTYNIGVGADYLIGADNPMPVPITTAAPVQNYKDQVVVPRANYKGEMVTPKSQFKDRGFKDQIVPPMEWEEYDNVNAGLLKWTAIPAVRVPQVLAKVNQRKILTVCVPPVFLTTILGGSIPPSPFTVNVAPNFSGSNLTFTVTVISPTPPAPSGVTIAGSVVSFSGLFGDATVSVTASNACGTATSNAFTVTS